MTKFLSAFLLLCTVTAFAQISFEKGYFIDTENNRTEVYIKNVDWQYAPASFLYKLSENETAREQNVQNLKEFAVYGRLKFVRATVDVDMSSTATNNLSDQRAPQFQKQQLFLRELLAGDATLYRHTTSQSIRYFFRVKDGEIKQLIYKPYLVNETGIGYNNDYQLQLEEGLKCSAVTQKDITTTGYKEKDLLSLFRKYNQCVDPTTADTTTQNTKGGKYNMYLRPRFNSSSHKLTYTNTNLNYDSDAQTVGAGVELEFVLPFNRNKWALIAEPEFQYFKTEKTIDVWYVPGGKVTSLVDYQAINIPLGVRHYMYLNKNSALFLNAQYVIAVTSGSSKVDLRRADGSQYNEFKIQESPTAVFGAGFNYRGKFSTEVRFTTGHSLLHNAPAWVSDFKTVSFVVGYNFL